MALKKQNIVIYRDTRGAVSLRVDLAKETVWATQAQIAELFDIDRTVVTRHIGNIFKSGEVKEKSNVQKMHIASSDKPVSLYSLDIILAVGYRTNSVQAITFRKWATKTLRAYILKGYVLDAKRLKASRETSVKELSKTLTLIQETIQKRQLAQSEVDSLLSVITGYANAWLLLQQYDEGGLPVRTSSKKGTQTLTYGTARTAIDALAKELRRKKEASDLFGNERSETLQGIVAGIYQAFGGRDVYPSLEEKAAHLLYFVIKDHPFSDGNKRIGSFLFILFLEYNGILYRKDGARVIDDRALVALALLVAESDPKEKEALVALITNLLVR
jgi:prophage maintenance system killer protein